MVQELKRYSQGQEQGYILDALKGIEHGRFLDIGAFNPTCFSNTRALYELGWSGVMVEPSPEPFLSLLKEYGKDERITLILAAIGLRGGMTKMHATADAVSTTLEEHRAKWERYANFYGSFLIPQIEPGEVCALGPFDFISVDTEGSSTDVFRSMLSWGFHPKAYCLEHDGRQAEILEISSHYGYAPVLENGENLVLVK